MEGKVLNYHRWNGRWKYAVCSKEQFNHISLFKEWLPWMRYLDAANVVTAFIHGRATHEIKGHYCQNQFHVFFIDLMPILYIYKKVSIKQVVRVREEILLLFLSPDSNWPQAVSNMDRENLKIVSKLPSRNAETIFLCLDWIEDCFDGAFISSTKSIKTVTTMRYWLAVAFQF